MSTITIDQNLLPVLQRLNEVTEMRDSHGTLLGYFAPAAQQHGRLYAKAFAMLDPEEVKRRKAQNAGHPGYPIQEVMQHLQALENKA